MSAVHHAQGRFGGRALGAFSVVALSPLGRPDPAVVAAACDAGALGVLDLGRDPGAARRALAALRRRLPDGFGVRIPDGIPLPELPAEARVVVVSAARLGDLAALAPRAVLVQATSVDEARAAVAAGAAGVIAKGSEAGGRIGDVTAFVLLQELAAAPDPIDVPVWVQGGVGVCTAAACAAGGAAGVVLDTQLALCRESTLGPAVRAAIATMDGSETAVLGGHRVFTRPDLPVAQLAGADADDVRARLGGDDLAKDLLPLGQDAAFARGFARRFGTVGGAVRGVRAAIARQLEAAAASAPLGPDSPLAAAHGVRYPIAQGPMSRVSDRAGFAAAVAAGGGLPFLALTLMSGREVRALLEETRALLGDRPWGVGILGFVPPEVREQQLAVLREIPPPVALIAGGRPSQATPLEAQGTATYLHVPSPGLLDLFLKDGARRFVFEGRECGGHVGPRSSFALWEAQLERLLAHPAAGEVSVLFAGGIHDARSAAMVAAMAAPLAARGAKIGVLMGTAYLFTEEAVASGAIQPGFQEAAIACQRTVLLETAPGHATRCADTAYAQAFADEKRRLAAEGGTAQDQWAELEKLNLGRLRIAAKGLRRDGDAIGAVDAEVQRAEGMYMIGQVAALRRATCTVAELHREVSEGGTAAVIEAARRVRAERAAETARAPGGVDVAVIGLAAIFPGAPDTDQFWRNIVGGKNAIREVSAERWDPAEYYDPASTGAGAGKKTPCKWGGFLDDVRFDPLRYGIPPRSLASIEPVQLLALEVARRAIGDAGYAVPTADGAGGRELDRERTSVIFGAEAGTDLSSAYGFRALYPHYVGPLPPSLDEALPELTEDSFPGVLSNVIAGRIANRLDLGGVNYTVDAACASSLAALDLGVKELALGTSDVVLCGGADLHNSINDYLLFASVHALSPTGQCHTFDASADGIVLGEGVACVVLKRLADAERDGDRVYAVLRGVAGASDGKSLGLTAPRKEGQVRALERAYRQARVSPAEVGLVEAHGTGTVVGDRTELATLTDVYAEAGAAPGACALGSVKSQIGHTKCAAGLAGFIKATLAVHHGVLPPTLNVKAPNPFWKPGASPFAFLDAARPWRAERRVAAVSAFGFGGTNFHAVVESHGPPAAGGLAAWPAELLLFRGEDTSGAVATIDRLRALLDGAPGEPPRLRDLARSVCAAGSGPVQVAIVADDVADLRAKLDAARALRGDRRGVFVAGAGAGVAGGKLALLCPGQGSQRPGMLAELFVAFPRLRRLLALGDRWAARMLPPAAFSREERAAQAAALTDTRVAQPALGVADLAVAELLATLGVQPDMAAGHSYGELAALCLAGAIGEADLLALSEARGECILAAAGDDPGAMAAVGADASAVAAHVAGDDGVVIANHNSPTQCVLSGPTAAIEATVARLAAAGITARRIPVACAFHSPIVAGARGALAAKLAAIDVAAPRFEVWSNVTAGPYPAEPDGVRALLAEQVARPVRFAEEVEAMYAAGARIFVEAGPGQVMTRLVGEILGARPHLAVACDGGGDAGLRQLLRAVGQLAVAGVPVEAGALFWDRDAALVELERPAGDARAATAWLVNGHRARPAAGAAAPAAAKVAMAAKAPVAARPAAAAAAAASAAIAPVRPAASAPAARAPAAAGPASAGDEVVLEYLRNVRALVAAQRDVMLQYLGSAPVVREVAAPSYVPAHGHVIDVVEAPAPDEAAAVAAEVAAGGGGPAAAPALDPMQLVLSIVSERTGYPIDTLGPDLDLEADLSIDSIKRIEIIGELAERLGLRVKGGADDGDAIVEELATRKTLRALVAWLEERIAGGGAAGEAAATDDDDAAAAPAPAAPPAPVALVAPIPARVDRYVLAVSEAPPPANGHPTLAGRHLALVDDGRGVATRLAALLEADGARVRLVAAGHGLVDGHGPVDGLVHLGALAALPEPDPVVALRALFEQVREAALGGASLLLVATALGGRFGQDATAAGSLRVGGAAGLIKTVAAEWPGIKARTVDLDPRDDAARLAARLRAELLASDDLVEVGYAEGVRSTRGVVAAPALAPAAAPLLDASSVVLLTGGARGITAGLAIELARRYRCRIELVGRSPLPPPAEDAATAAAADLPALRRALLAGALREPAAIEARAARILADREIRATLAAIRAAGATVDYHAVDVRTPAFGALIDELYHRHGRLDGVVHGAGVLDDKLLRHKTPEAFERVVATKLTGAITLAERVRADARFVVFFASIAGAFGNRGQVDYAAANDALDTLAWSLAPRIAGRVVSIDWGPWAGAGMVSPELEREYARRGIGLIDAERGIAALLAELGAGGEAQVVLMAGDPHALAAQAPGPPRARRAADAAGAAVAADG